MRWFVSEEIPELVALIRTHRRRLEAVYRSMESALDGAVLNRERFFMSDEMFLLSTSAEVPMALPVGEALEESGKPECTAYGDIFLERAGAAEAAGDSGVARRHGPGSPICVG